MKTTLAAALFAVLIACPAAAQDAPSPDAEKRAAELIRKLGSDDWDERAEAERALGEMGQPAVGPLKQAMETADDPEVRVRAKRLLQKLGSLETPSELDAGQFEELCEILRSQDGVSWYSARQAKPYFYMYPLYERPEFAEAVKNPKFAPTLAKALSDDSSNLKRNATFLLGEMGNKSVAPAIAALLTDEEGLTRAVALHALGKLDDQTQVRAVIACLKDTEEVVRVAGTAALEGMVTAESIEPLIAALKDESPNVRFNAYFSLCSLTGQRFRFNAWSDAAVRASGIRTIEEWWVRNREGFKPLPPKKAEKPPDESVPPPVRVR
ncbi:MAG: HEAT repeat domain-containing protein [Candidatus Brocadiae bacterium]|nr:HEAT repeat domain-containing protein [Candidatus Brocadiia bacterium]